jgi:hypothetical protein
MMSERPKITIYLDSDLRRELKHLSVDEDRTMSELVTGFIRSGLRRMKTAPPPPHHPEPPPLPEKGSDRG